MACAAQPIECRVDIGGIIAAEGTADPATHAAILHAAFAQIVEGGWASFSIEAVAARAGVGKAAIYRRWPGRAELALDAFFSETADTLAFPNRAHARDAFREQILALAELLRGPAGTAFAALAAGARSDPAIGRAIAERWVLPRKRWGVERLTLAIADGQAPPGLDVDAALSALYSPIYAALLLGRGVEPPDRVAACLAIVFSGIFPEQS